MFTKTQSKCLEPRQNINTVLKVLSVKIKLLGSSVKTDQMRKEALNNSYTENLYDGQGWASSEHAPITVSSDTMRQSKGLRRSI